MGVKVGNHNLIAPKYGEKDILVIYLGLKRVWPEQLPSDIDLEELAEVLSCISLGQWVDVLPWNDAVLWKDNINI